MKIIICFILLTLPLEFNCSKKAFSKISREISMQQKKTRIRSGVKDYYHEIRMKLWETGKLDFCCKADTFFLLESYDIENGNFYCQIWNTKNKVTYTYNRGNFVFDSIGVYSRYTIEIIQAWDINAIRYEEKTNSRFTNPLTINGSRVTNSGGDIKVDCITFKQFFLLERDRFGAR